LATLARSRSGQFRHDATNGHIANRQDESWLYLSTMIDQRPRDANSYYSVGQWYRGRSKLDEAQQWYGRAYEWDTANPRWLLERAQLLVQLDRNAEARELFQQIVDGKWATGLQGYVDQARNALNN
jgi:cytochrome c-type biogenesis protein CcmH/NrfG